MKKIKRTPPLPIHEIGKMIKINGIVSPQYDYSTEENHKRYLFKIPKEPMMCYVLKHKIVQLGIYRKGHHVLEDEDWTVRPYLEVTHTEKVYLCTTSIVSNKPSFLVHPDNIIEINEAGEWIKYDNKQTTTTPKHTT